MDGLVGMLWTQGEKGAARVGPWAAESQVLRVLSLTHPSRWHYQASDPKEGPGWLLPTVCMSVYLPGPSGTPWANWPPRRDGTPGEC